MKDGRSQQTHCDKPKARGRPRDPNLEGRVFDAAISIYANGGWPDFSFDAVAKAAGVGKTALYSRWPTPGDLLYETLEARWYRVSSIDTGSLRDDLLALAHLCLDSLVGPHGSVVLHLRHDTARFKEVRDFARKYSEKLVHQGRQIVRRAIERRELPASVKPGLIMDVVVGAVTNHVVSTPKRLRAAMVEQSDHFIQELVGLVLSGAADARR